MTRPKRAHGEGGAPVWDAANKRWRAHYTGADGARRTVNSKISAADCRRLRDNALADARAGIVAVVAPARMTLARYLNDWATTWVDSDPKYDPRTVREYRRAIRLHIEPAIGGVGLAKLTTTDVQRMLNTLAAKGLSATSRQLVFDVLNRALKMAMEERKVHLNPCTSRLRPARDTAKVKPWTLPQAAVFLDAVADDRLAAMWHAVVLMGLRRGEAIGLQWADIDWDASTVTISGQVDRFTRTRKARKGHAEPIVHVMPGRVRELLVARKAAQVTERFHAGVRWIGDKPGDGLVFTARFGTPLGANWVTERWKVLATRAGVPLIPRSAVHGGRHFAASAQFAAGARMTEVAAFLGHTDSSTVTAMYVHLTEQASADAAARMDALFPAHGAQRSRS
jgi:integrase